MKRYFLLLAFATSTAVYSMGNVTNITAVDGEKFNALTKELQAKSPVFHSQLKWNDPEGIQWDCMANIYFMSNAYWQQIDNELHAKQK
jgi:hypothetical protein